MNCLHLYSELVLTIITDLDHFEHSLFENSHGFLSEKDLRVNW